MTFINQLIAGFMATIMSLFGLAAPLDNNGVHSQAAAAHVENATAGDNAPSAQPGGEPGALLLEVPSPAHLVSRSHLSITTAGSLPWPPDPTAAA